MTINYKIIAFDEAAGQVIIRVGDLPPTAVDLPIDNAGNLPTGEALTYYLSGFIPTWYFERQEKLAKGIANGSAISALVEPEPVIPPTTEQIARIVRDQRDTLLVASDWTQTLDAPLTEIARTAWATYRQALRDLPEQAGFPTNIQWPISPGIEPR